MHEIKFRGKRIDNGEWVYGMPYSFKSFFDIRTEERYILMFNPEWDLEAQFNYLKDPVAFSHLENSIWKVVPESVGQFTGCCDKNGKEIYEGDVFKITPDPEETNYVEFEGGEYLLIPHELSLNEWCQQGVVIGNKSENPELMRN